MTASFAPSPNDGFDLDQHRKALPALLERLRDNAGLLAGTVMFALALFALYHLAYDFDYDDVAAHVVELSGTVLAASLLLTALGYMSGRYRELRDASHALVPAIGAVVATLLYEVTFSLMQFLLGVESPVSGLVVRDLLIGALVNGVLATPLFAVVRTILRPTLVEPFRPRRRGTPIGLRV